MPENNEIQVDTTEQKKGKVTIGFNNNPTPTILARVTKGLRYFCVSLITMVSATDIFSGGQAKIINFSLGVFVLFTAFVDIIIGVSPDKKDT